MSAELLEALRHNRIPRILDQLELFVLTRTQRAIAGKVGQFHGSVVSIIGKGPQLSILSSYILRVEISG